MRHHVPFCLPFQILSQYHTKMTSLGPGVSLSLQPEDKIGEIWTYLFSFFSYWSKFYIVLRGNNRNISTKKIIGEHFFYNIGFTWEIPISSNFVKQNKTHLSGSWDDSVGI